MSAAEWEPADDFGWVVASAALEDRPPSPKSVQEDDPDVRSGQSWFACHYPERAFDSDTALHDCCRACLLAAQVAVGRGYLPNTEHGHPLLTVLAGRLEEHGEAPA